MKPEKPNILVLAPFFPDKKRPYRGIFFKDHAEALSLKFKVSVATVEVPSLREGYAYSRIQKESFQHFDLLRITHPVVTHRSKKSITTAYEKAFDRIKSEIPDPDLLLCETSLPLGNLGIQYAKRGIPLITLEHYSFLDEQIRSQREETEQVYVNSTVIAGVSEFHAELITSEFDLSVEIIPNCLGSEFDRVSFVSKTATPPFRLLWVGRNHPVKNLNRLLQAVEHLPENVEIKVIGISERDIKDFSQLSSKVKLIPDATRMEIIQEYMHAHILVSSSDRETFGMAMLEALACGTPVVSTPSGGPFFINDKNGIIAPDFKPESLATAILKAIKQYDQYDREQISWDVKERFGPESFAERILNLSGL